MCSNSERSAPVYISSVSASSSATGSKAGSSGVAAFNPFLSGISYQPLQVPEVIQAPKKDYIAELDNLINRSLFGNMI